jgi:thiosulfate/3-mercaptopyruvate sulfurtransferase
MYTNIMSAAELQAELQNPQLVVVDCRFDLSRPDTGRKAYVAGHIPGAFYAHLDKDLSGGRTSSSGRHPLPDPETLSETLGRWGVDAHSQVVTYDAQNGSMAAARLWWLLKWLGHEAAAVLDGGLQAWQAASLPLSTEIPARGHAHFVPQLRNDRLVVAQELEARMRDASWRILDARSPERYAGEVEPIDPVAGHVPGAINHPFARNLTDDGHFLPKLELQKNFGHTLEQRSPDHIIAMCGSGVTAAHLLLAMEAAGLHGARLYAGSWSEWISDSSRPVATGRG